MENIQVFQVITINLYKLDTLVIRETLRLKNIFKVLQEVSKDTLKHSDRRVDGIEYMEWREYWDGSRYSKSNTGQMKAINVNKIDFKAKKKSIENFNKNSSLRNKTILHSICIQLT